MRGISRRARACAVVAATGVAVLAGSGVAQAQTEGRQRTGDGVPSGIGLYGRGVTLLAVAPVPWRLASALEDTLAISPDAVDDDAGLRAAAGPVGLMVVRQPGSGAYLLTGTVTLDALAAAAGELPDLGGRR